MRGEGSAFDAVKNEMEAEALIEGRKQCAIAMEGNRQSIEAIKEMILESPGKEDPYVIAYFVRQFAAYGGEYEIDFDTLLIMWVTSMLMQARSELAS